MRTSPWLQSLTSLLSQSLSHRARAGGRPPDTRRASPRPETKRPPARQQKRAEAPEDGTGRRAAPAPEPAQPPKAASPPAEPAPSQPPAEPVRYMQRQDRYMELLARNTHEL